MAKKQTGNNINVLNIVNKPIINKSNISKSNQIGQKDSPIQSGDI